MSQYPFQDTLAQFDQQVRDAMISLLQAHLPLGIDARTLDDARLWELLCHASTRQGYIESSCQSLHGAPSGNTVRAHLNAALDESAGAMAQLEDQLNRALHAQLPRRLSKELRTRAWEAAGDWVAIPYHGQCEPNDKEVRAGQPKAGTSRFHTYATLALLHKHRRVTIALTVVRQGETMVEVVRRLLERARSLGLRFKRTYWDKAFGTIEVMRHLRARRVPYIIALARRGKNGLKRLCGGRRSYRTRYTFRSAGAGSYTTDVVIACKYSRRRFKRPGIRYFAFAVYRIAAMEPLQVAAAYRRRFSIESGYRQLHQVRARTTSRNHALRLLLIGLAVLLVNLYVLLRRACGIVTQYGSRCRRVALTLEQLALVLCQHIQLWLGLNQVTQQRACTLLS